MKKEKLIFHKYTPSRLVLTEKYDIRTAVENLFLSWLDECILMKYVYSYNSGNLIVFISKNNERFMALQYQQETMWVNRNILRNGVDWRVKIDYKINMLLFDVLHRFLNLTVLVFTEDFDTEGMKINNLELIDYDIDNPQPQDIKLDP